MDLLKKPEGIGDPILSYTKSPEVDSIRTEFIKLFSEITSTTTNSYVIKKGFLDDVTRYVTQEQKAAIQCYFGSSHEYTYNRKVFHPTISKSPRIIKRFARSVAGVIEAFKSFRMSDSEIKYTPVEMMLKESGYTDEHIRVSQISYGGFKACTNHGVSPHLKSQHNLDQILIYLWYRGVFIDILGDKNHTRFSPGNARKFVWNESRTKELIKVRHTLSFRELKENEKSYLKKYKEYVLNLIDSADPAEYRRGVKLARESVFILQLGINPGDYEELTSDKSIHGYDKYRLDLINIRDKYKLLSSINEDSYSNRMHTFFTTLPKKIRNRLTLGGHRMIECDVNAAGGRFLMQYNYIKSVGEDYSSIQDKVMWRKDCKKYIDDVEDMLKRNKEVTSDSEVNIVQLYRKMLSNEGDFYMNLWKYLPVSDKQKKSMEREAKRHGRTIREEMKYQLMLINKSVAKNDDIRLLDGRKVPAALKLFLCLPWIRNIVPYCQFRDSNGSLHSYMATIVQGLEVERMSLMNYALATGFRKTNTYKLSTYSITRLETINLMSTISTIPMLNVHDAIYVAVPEDIDAKNLAQYMSDTFYNLTGVAFNIEDCRTGSKIDIDRTRYAVDIFGNERFTYEIDGSHAKSAIIAKVIKEW